MLQNYLKYRVCGIIILMQSQLGAKILEILCQDVELQVLTPSHHDDQLVIIICFFNIISNIFWCSPGCIIVSYCWLLFARKVNREMWYRVFSLFLAIEKCNIISRLFCTNLVRWQSYFPNCKRDKIWIRNTFQRMNCKYIPENK